MREHTYDSGPVAAELSHRVTTQPQRLHNMYRRVYNMYREYTTCTEEYIYNMYRRVYNMYRRVYNMYRGVYNMYRGVYTMYRGGAWDFPLCSNDRLTHLQRKTGVQGQRSINKKHNVNKHKGRESGDEAKARDTLV